MTVADELKDIVKAVQSDETIHPLEIAEGWLYWFKKRGDKYLRDAAKLGYDEATIDLPIEIGKSFNEEALRLIQKVLREFLDGCFVGFVEDEYDGKPIARLYVSWKCTF
jgi:hypothetical protein